MRHLLDIRVLLVAIAITSVCGIAVTSILLVRDFADRRQLNETVRQLEAEVARSDQTSAGAVQQTILGCQRGNVLRLAVRRLQMVEGQDLTVAISSCRRTVVAVHGVDPGPTPNLPGG